MKPVKTWKRMFNTVKPRLPKSAQLTETVDNNDFHFRGLPSGRTGDFKALTLEGIVLSFDSDEINIIYDPGIIYVSVTGKLIILYDRKEDLDGFWFVAKSIQKIRMTGINGNHKKTN